MKPNTRFSVYDKLVYKNVNPGILPKLRTLCLKNNNALMGSLRTKNCEYGITKKHSRL